MPVPRVVQLVTSLVILIRQPPPTGELQSSDYSGLQITAMLSQQAQLGGNSRDTAVQDPK